MKMELSLVTTRLENVIVKIMWTAMNVANVWIGIMVIHIAKVSSPKLSKILKR